MIIILAQNTIGVAATYEIYSSFSSNDTGDWKNILAIFSMVFIGFGIGFGVWVVKKYEHDLVDVDEESHSDKTVCQRYGPIYSEYKFQRRYFFVAKMALSLITGIAAGYVGASAYIQIAVALAPQVFFNVCLQVLYPMHEPIAQTTTNYSSIIKIATLIFTFFLAKVYTTDGSPTAGQNRISMVIVALNMVGIMLTVTRTAYPLYVTYRANKKASVEEAKEGGANAMDAVVGTTGATGATPKQYMTLQTPGAQSVL